MGFDFRFFCSLCDYCDEISIPSSKTRFEDIIESYEDCKYDEDEDDYICLVCYYEKYPEEEPVCESKYIDVTCCNDYEEESIKVNKFHNKCKDFGVYKDKIIEDSIECKHCSNYCDCERKYLEGQKEYKYCPSVYFV